MYSIVSNKQGKDSLTGVGVQADARYAGILKELRRNRRPDSEKDYDTAYSGSGHQDEMLIEDHHFDDPSAPIQNSPDIFENSPPYPGEEVLKSEGRYDVIKVQEVKVMR